MRSNRIYTNQKYFILGVIFFFSILAVIPSISTAQNSNQLSTPATIQIEEYVESYNSNFNSTSITISPPTAVSPVSQFSTWNLTDINIKFDNIHQKSYTQVIAGGAAVFGVLSESGNVYALANEIQLDFAMNLASVDLFCYADEIEDEIVNVQIQGYDPETNLPNSTIYGNPVSLNTSSTPNWYRQTFNTSINLPAGKYYLVLNASQVEDDDLTVYWRYGDFSLLNSAFYTNNWSITPIMENLCYKLNQKQVYYDPSELDMQIQIGEVNYKVSIVPLNGSWNLIVNNIDLSLDIVNHTLEANFYHPVQLYFDFKYIISLKRIFEANGTVHIGQDEKNFWNIFPDFEPVGVNRSYRVAIPDNWENLTFYRDGIDITSFINHSNHYFIVPYSLLQAYSVWEITAYSPPINPDLELPTREISTGENLQVSINLPITQGVIIVQLKSPSDQIIYSETISINQSSIDLELNIPQDTTEGLYELEIYWYGNNQAGVQIETIYLKNNFLLEGLNQLIILFSIVLGLTISISTYSYIKIKHRKLIREEHDTVLAEAKNETFRKYQGLMYNLFKDHFNLEHIMIIERSSGRTIFYKSFLYNKGIINFDPNLLKTLIKFTDNLLSETSKSIFSKINYFNKIILNIEYRYFKILFLMSEEPSLEFIKTIKELSNDIESHFSYKFQNFKGDVSVFSNIIDVLNDYLLVVLLYPLSITIPNSNEVNQEEEDMLKEIFEIMKINKNRSFYMKDLFSLDEFNIKKAEIALRFSKEDIIRPILF